MIIDSTLLSSMARALERIQSEAGDVRLQILPLIVATPPMRLTTAFGTLGSSSNQEQSYFQSIAVLSDGVTAPSISSPTFSKGLYEVEMSCHFASNFVRAAIPIPVLGDVQVDIRDVGGLGGGKIFNFFCGGGMKSETQYAKYTIQPFADWNIRLQMGNPLTANSTWGMLSFNVSKLL